MKPTAETLNEIAKKVVHSHSVEDETMGEPIYFSSFEHFRKELSQTAKSGLNTGLIEKFCEACIPKVEGSYSERVPTRPRIIDFFGKEATIGVVQETYASQPALFNYTQALDWHIDAVLPILEHRQGR